MPDPESFDLEKVKSLIAEGKFYEAFQEFPFEMRKKGFVHSLQTDFQKQVEKLIETNAFQGYLADCLIGRYFEEAASVLACHPEVRERILSTRKKIKAVMPKQPGPSDKEVTIPSFIPEAIDVGFGIEGFREAERRMIFGVQEEELAREVFGMHPAFQKWKEYIASKTIPSQHPFDDFAGAKFTELKKDAQRKSNKKNLSDLERNALHHFERTVQVSTRRAEELVRSRTFTHLIEQFFLKFLEETRGVSELEEIYLASREEDIYEGVDLYVKERGRWLGYDITVSEEEKHPRFSWRYPQHLNFLEFLKTKGEEFPDYPIKAATLHVDRELFGEATKQFFLALRSGKQPSAEEIVHTIAKLRGSEGGLKEFERTLGIFRKKNLEP